MHTKIVLVASLILLLAGTSLTAQAGGGATLNLTDFGAVGDKTTDDGPALQRALDALADAGGGTLIVPKGTYAILTPVSKNFTGLASSVMILGVESSTPVNTKASGAEISKGLDLSSKFYPRTGTAQDAVRVTGLQSFLIKDIAFVGTPGVTTDAKNTLVVNNIGEAVISHCEFYGLSTQVAGGSIVMAIRSVLKFEHSKVLGSTGNSAYYVPIIQNLYWKGIQVINSAFVDYGQGSGFYGKMTVSPISWINIANAGPITNDSPRREVIIRDVFLDEGGWVGIYSLPHRYQSPSISAKVDLIYITDLTMNVSNFWTHGNDLHDTRSVLIEKSRYAWSHKAYSAIMLRKVGTAILDRVECLEGANRIVASNVTDRLYVINSVYTTIYSQAQMTKTITTATAEEDPVQYVRQQYQLLLGREPDPAGHFYWSNLLVRCEDDAPCIEDTRANLNAYLSSSPTPNFALQGRVTDENGQALSGFAVTLSGAQSVTTQTDANGQYMFSGLPTSGVYTVRPSASLYTFEPAELSFTTPAGDRTAQDFIATRKTYSISGKLSLGSARFDDQQMRLTSSNPDFTPRTITPQADGGYTFDGVPAGYTYTVGPVEGPVYSYLPASRAITNLLADQAGRNFTVARKAYAVSGRVLLGGTGLDGVALQLRNSSGSVIKTVTTSTSEAGLTGSYSFTVVAAGFNYTVTPVSAVFSFGPAIKSYAPLTSNQTAQGFIATRKTYSISGKLSLGSAELSDQKVRLTRTTSGFTPVTVTTQSDGSYTFTSVPAGYAYTVEPLASQVFSYAPANRVFTNLSADQVGRNFTATRTLYEISGRALFNSEGLNGVIILLKNGSGAIIRRVTTTTSDTGVTGFYRFDKVPAGLSYTVEPALNNAYSYPSPVSRSYASLAANVYGQHFSVKRKLFAVSGKVVKAGTTTGIGSVTMTLTDASGAAIKVGTTRSDGTYVLTGIPGGGNYTLRPTKTGLVFTPTAKSYMNLGVNRTLQDFVGK
ncbi:MAG TPA: carboxypeptidase regulatory-like domain-containing protein [Pyrinomonadaceae bacterium]|nr:carboxypeptidase regulatory-like domain-containing protein [Pyrinomonadaceae bacterium]